MFTSQDMASSSKDTQKYLQPPRISVPSEESSSTQQRDYQPQPQTKHSPVSSEHHSPWFREPKPDRLRHVQLDEGRPLARLEDDAELGVHDDAAGGPKRRSIICGCSQSTFITILFFVLVVIAAAIGGGVGGSLFASKR